MSILDDIWNAGVDAEKKKLGKKIAGDKKPPATPKAPEPVAGVPLAAPVAPEAVTVKNGVADAVPLSKKTVNIAGVTVGVPVLIAIGGVVWWLKKGKAPAKGKKS